MPIEAVFFLQFALSIVVWSVVLWLAVWPRLSRLARNDRLMWLALPHCFRHIGMVFLVPGVGGDGLAESFAVPAAYGDLAAGVLALAAVLALRLGWPGAIALAWVFNLVGSIDLVNALCHREVIEHFGAGWFIPTFVVPLLLVTHALSFRELVRPRAASG